MIRFCLLAACLCFLFLGLTVSSSLAQSQSENDKLDFTGFRPSFDYEGLEGTSAKQIIGPEDIQGYLARAVDNLEHGELDRAKNDLNYVIEHNNEYGGAFFYRGVCYKGLLKIDSAIADFEKAISLKTFQFFGPSHIELGYIQINFYQDYDKAQEHFDLAYKLNSEDPQVNYAMGYLYYKTFDFGRALRFVKRSIELTPTYPQSYYLLAEIRLRQGLLPKARSAIDQLLEQYPEDERALIFKSSLYPHQNQLKKGIEILESLLEKNPNNQQALLGLGLMYLNDKESVKGFKYIGKGLELRKFSRHEFGISPLYDEQLKLAFTILHIANEIDSYSEKMQKLALILFQNSNARLSDYSPLKEYEKFGSIGEYIPTGIYMLHSIIAENNIDQRFWERDNLMIIERDTTIYHVYRSLGNYYHKVDNFKAAEINYTKMLYLDRDIADGYRLRGLNRSKHNQFIKSVQDFNIYLNFNKINADVLEERAECYLKLGYLELAEEDYNTVLDISPSIVRGRTYLNLATLKAHQGDTLSAIAVFDKAIDILEKGTLNSDRKLSIYVAYNLRGNLKLMSNLKMEAIEDFTRAIESDSYYDLAYFNRGIANYRLGNFEEANKDFSRWLEMHNGDPDGLYWRGKTKLKLNEVAEAVIDLERAVDLGITEAKELLGNINR